MMTFSYKYPPDFEMTVSISEDSSLDTAIATFEKFLRGAGYGFDGTIELVEAPDVVH